MMVVKGMSYALNNPTKEILYQVSYWFNASTLTYYALFLTHNGNLLLPSELFLDDIYFH